MAINALSTVLGFVNVTKIVKFHISINKYPLDLCDLSLNQIGKMNLIAECLRGKFNSVSEASLIVHISIEMQAIS